MFISLVFYISRVQLCILDITRFGHELLFYKSNADPKTSSFISLQYITVMKLQLIPSSVCKSSSSVSSSTVKKVCIPEWILLKYSEMSVNNTIFRTKIAAIYILDDNDDNIKALRKHWLTSELSDNISIYEDVFSAL